MSAGINDGGEQVLLAVSVKVPGEQAAKVPAAHAAGAIGEGILFGRSEYARSGTTVIQQNGYRRGYLGA